MYPYTFAMFMGQKIKYYKDVNFSKMSYNFSVTPYEMLGLQSSYQFFWGKLTTDFYNVYENINGSKKVKAILMDDKNSNEEHILRSRLILDRVIKTTYCQYKKTTRPMELKSPETEPPSSDQTTVQWGKDGLSNKCYWSI